MIRKRLRTLAALVVLLLGLGVSSAQACPSCKAANETDSRLPKAYMYSILFMLGVPVTMVTGFGIGFYRLSKRQREALEARYNDGGVELPSTDE